MTWSQKKFKLLKIDDKTAPKAMVSRKRAVEAGLEICNEIYDPTNDRFTEREKHLKSEDAMMKYQMATKSVQNRRQVKKKSTSKNSWIGGQKGIRSAMQSKVSHTDYALDDFALDEED